MRLSSRLSRHMATHSNGISARQLQHQLGLGSYKSAWLMCSKLRHSMVAPGRHPLAGCVEVDETPIVCRSKDDPPVVAGSQPPRQNPCRRCGRGRGWRRRSRPHPAQPSTRLLGRHPAYVSQDESRTRRDRQDRRVVGIPRRPWRRSRSACHRQNGRPYRSALDAPDLLQS